MDWQKITLQKGIILVSFFLEGFFKASNKQMAWDIKLDILVSRKYFAASNSKRNLQSSAKYLAQSREMQ